MLSDYAAVKGFVAKLAESFGMICTAPKVSATFATVGKYRSLEEKNASRRCLSPRRGFSLVELIVVMVILGMLAGLVAVRTRGYLINSKQNAAKTEIANIVKALETFYAAEGRYPTTDEGLEILTLDSESFPGGILNKVPNDPWKRPYEYVSPGSSQPYEVICLGADGREGGDGENQDFSSETLGDDA